MEIHQQVVVVREKERHLQLKASHEESWNNAKNCQGINLLSYSVATVGLLLQGHLEMLRNGIAFSLEGTVSLHHGSNMDWKNGKTFSSSQGILNRLEKFGEFTQNTGKIRTVYPKCWKRGEF